MLGHGRPLGTTANVRMDWAHDRDPALEDVTRESGTHRWYLVVGVAEHRDSPAVWRLTLERVSPEQARDRLADGAEFWQHVRYRRTRGGR